MNKRMLAASALIALAIVPATAVTAQDGRHGPDDNNLTLAVYGGAPYGTPRPTPPNSRRPRRSSTP